MHMYIQHSFESIYHIIHGFHLSLPNHYLVNCILNITIRLVPPFIVNTVKTKSNKFSIGIGNELPMPDIVYRKSNNVF